MLGRMKDVSEHRRREVKTYFDVIARGGSDRLIEARSFHNLGEYTAADFDRVSSLLSSADTTGSFAFLGRDADRYAGAIENLAAEGHEIVLHGHRHVAAKDASYEFAHENLSRGLDAIEDATGSRPRGYFAPLQELSQGALDAAADLDFEWVLGTTDGSLPADLTLVDPHHPYDLVMLNRGDSPAETFATIEDGTESGEAFLFHPNMLEYYDAMGQFESWIAETRPVCIDTLVNDGGVGVLLDAMRPLRIE
jgi:hypothetical protein